MSKSRVFNCFHNVSSVDQGYQWIQFKLEDNNDIKWYRAQCELTEAGQIHVQAVFGYQNARYLGSVQKFIGEPSIQITQDTEKMYYYCTNEEKRVAGSVLKQKGEYKVQTNGDQWKIDFEYASSLPTVKDSLAHMLKTHPKHYCSQMKQLTNLFNSLKPKKDRIKYTLDQFTEPPIPEQDLKERAIILVGRSSLGKTNYAKAHFKNPVVVKNKTDYSKITDDNDGIIFDDIEMYNWAPMTVRNLVDLQEGGTHDIKYGSIYIPEGMPRFVIINREENFWPKCLFNDEGEIDDDCLIDYESIQKRVIFKHYEKPLFDKPMEDLQKEYDRSCSRVGKARKNPHTLKKRFNADDYITTFPY